MLRHYIVLIILARMEQPTHIGHYQIIETVGTGGMATVYRARDPKFNREVAIKVLPPSMLHDATFRVRFEREVKTLAALEHPFITPVYDAGEDNGQPYFVMRYMPGGSLRDSLQNGKLPLQDATRIFTQIAQGIDYAHKKGFVHRDIKPDNILFDQEGNACLSDFGIAKLYGGTGNLTEQKPIGTATYMSPEQARGEKLDPRSDIYSLGALLYHMLTGQPPYQAETSFSIAYKQINDPAPEILHVMPSLPPAIDGVIKTALAKDKNRRYANSIDMAKALHVIVFGGEDKAFAPPTNAKKTSLAAGAVVLLIIAAGIFMLSKQLFAPAPSAANANIAAPLSTETQTPPPTESSTPTRAALAPQNTAAAEASATLPSPSPVAVFAPACAAPPVIATPIIKDIDKFCVEKNAYTTLSIPAEATFESLDPDFFCKIEYTRDGKSALSCTGKTAYAFLLKVCLPQTITLDETQCQDGLQFDPANQCCAAPAADAACRIYKVETRGCP